MDIDGRPTGLCLKGPGGGGKGPAQKKKANPFLSEVRLEELEEGESAQILHVGPYSDEATDIKKLHDHIASLGKRTSGKHHEIYMNSPMREPPEKLKTVIRQPFS